MNLEGIHSKEERRREKREKKRKTRGEKESDVSRHGKTQSRPPFNKKAKDSVALW
jgi:hypothetical protein